MEKPLKKSCNSNAYGILSIVLPVLLLLAGCGERSVKTAGNAGYEVMYHVFQRSFYDSNGDGHGDLQGLRQQLDYLQELGVNAILLLPLYESEYYHNYFAGDFKKIDPEFGALQDYLDLVKAVHQRGMKLYMDMETQYVTEDHIWYKDSYKNPASEYSDYIVYNDAVNSQPESIIFGLTELEGYNGVKRKVATVKLESPKVQEYNYQLFSYWIDPNGDGKFDDGVDGFRLDHMMDNLDWKNKFTNLFTTFWNPLISRLKKLNPDITILAEQAEWGSWGTDYFKTAGTDRVFAFNLQQAIVSFDKNRIAAMADSTFAMTPAGKQQIVFLENHDMQRFASAVNSHGGKLRVGAALNLLLGGTPSIYYGQELGMTGSGGFGKFGNTDANDIPQREAFEWYSADTGRGMALWYKNTGPWWDQTNLYPRDGISLEEQRNNPNSLWNFYKDMISLRNKHAVLARGAYQTLQNDNNNVFSFLRYEQGKGIVIAVNLSDAVQQTSIDFTHSKVTLQQAEHLYGQGKAVPASGRLSVDVPAYGIGVWEVINEH